MVYNVDTLNMVDIGWTGENNATVISIDVKSWLGRWPDAQISLVVCRPKEDVFYPVVVEQKNHFAIWRVTLADVSIPGMGNAVLYAKSRNEDVIAKHPFRLRVNAALDSELKDPPEVGREWLEQVLDAADRAEAAQASYYTPKMDGYELVWEPSWEGLPALPKTNIRGEKGETGVGVASIQQTHKSTEDGGLNVWQATLTDGTQSAFTVVNGSKGSQGVPGERGPQGEPGIQGERGRGIRSIEEIKSSTEDGGYNMWDVTMTDGSLDARLYVRNGSKGSTGERGPAGPQGPTGAPGSSGVYIGKEAPTDANVWIDPEGKGTETLPNPHPLVINGVSYDGSERVEIEEGEFKFLKTITISAEQQGIAKVEETYANGYDAIMVVVTGFNTGTNTKKLYAGVGQEYMTRGTGGNIGKNQVGRFIFRKLKGVWDVFGYIGPSDSESTMIGQVSAQNISNTKDNNAAGFTNGFPKVKYLRVYTFEAAGFPEGTTINIYGAVD